MLVSSALGAAPNAGLGAPAGAGVGFAGFVSSGVGGEAAGFDTGPRNSLDVPLGLVTPAIAFDEAGKGSNSGAGFTASSLVGAGFAKFAGALGIEETVRAVATAATLGGAAAPVCSSGGETGWPGTITETDGDTVSSAVGFAALAAGAGTVRLSLAGNTSAGTLPCAESDRAEFELLARDEGIVRFNIAGNTSAGTLPGAESEASIHFGSATAVAEPGSELSFVFGGGV
jgi:hypothetical protein